MRLMWVLIVALPLLGCSKGPSSSAPQMMWQAVYSNPEGESWLGPKRLSSDAAMADAEAYELSHPGVDGVVVVRVPVDSMRLERGPIPPNPIARRALDVPVTLENVVGEWRVDFYEADPDAHNDKILLNADGTASTTIKWRMEDGTGTDRWEVLNDSSLAYEPAWGELQIFSVMQFDGEHMEVYVNGYRDQLLILSRLASDTADAEQPDVPEDPVEREPDGG